MTSLSEYINIIRYHSITQQSASGINTADVSVRDSGTFVFERKRAESLLAVLLWNFTSCDVDGDGCGRFFREIFLPGCQKGLQYLYQLHLRTLKPLLCFSTRIRKTLFSLCVRSMLVGRSRTLYVVLVVFFKSRIHSFFFQIWIFGTKHWLLNNLAWLKQKPSEPSVYSLLQGKRSNPQFIPSVRTPGEQPRSIKKDKHKVASEDGTSVWAVSVVSSPSQSLVFVTSQRAALQSWHPGKVSQKGDGRFWEI